MLDRFKEYINTEFGKKLTIITCVAVDLRLLVVAFTAKVSTRTDLLTDQASYISIGQELSVNLFPYTNFSRPPLYPYLVAIVIKMQNRVGLSDLPLRVSMGLVQVILGTSIVVLVALLLKKRINSNVAIFTAWLLAIWPNLVINTGSIMTERLSTPLVVLSITILFWKTKPSLLAITTSSVVMSFAILTRPALWPILIVIITYAVFKLKGSWRYNFMLSHLLILAFMPSILILGAWIKYSYEQKGEFLFIVDTNGYNMCLGNNPYATGRYGLEEGHQDYCEWTGNDKEQLQRALDWVSNNPSEQPNLILNRFGALMDFDSDGLSYYPGGGPSSELPGSPISIYLLGVIFFLWWLVIVQFTLIGLFHTLWEKHRTYGWILAIGFAGVIMPLITFGESRFHDVIIPLMAVLVAEARELIESYQSSKFKTNFPTKISDKYKHHFNLTI